MYFIYVIVRVSTQLFEFTYSYLIYFEIVHSAYFLEILIFNLHLSFFSDETKGRMFIYSYIKKHGSVSY